MPSPFVPDLEEIRRVPAGTALRLPPCGTGRELLVLRGRAWITLQDEGRPALCVAPLGDHFIAAGERLHLPAGCAAVVEASGMRGEAVAFGWQVRAAERTRGERWAAQVALPWRDLRSAAAAVAVSGRRLAQGLLACAFNADRF